MKTKIMPNNSKRYLALDGLRGIAAMAVILGHLSNSFYGHEVLHGYLLAVPFFFMLSGFVLEFVYNGRLTSLKARIKFMVQRMVRLYPLAIFAALITTVYVAEQLATGRFPPNEAAPALVSSFTVLPTIHIGSISWHWPLNRPLWSLFWELVASAGFGFLFCRCRSAVLVTVAIAALIGMAWLSYNSVVLISVLKGQGLLAAFAFTVGCLAYRWRSMFTLRSSVLQSVTLVAFVAVMFSPFKTGALFDLIFIAIVAPIILLSQSHVEVKGWLGTVCEWVGELSYPIYIIHWPVMLLMKDLLHFQSATAGFVASLFITVVMSVIASRAFDRPVRAKLRQIPGLSKAFHLNKPTDLVCTGRLL